MSEESTGIPPEKRVFVARTKQMIKERGLSQRRLAQLACVPSGSISDFLYGNRIPRKPEIESLAEVLGVPASWLWGHEESFSPTPKQETTAEELLANINEVSIRIRSQKPNDSARLQY